MPRFIRRVAAVIICLGFGMVNSANSAPIKRGVAGTGVAHRSGVVHVQGFYRVARFHGLHSFYRQYPYTLFGYPN